MALEKGVKKIQFTDEERADIVERVCALYETQNSTIESCCAACGIGQASFYLWCSHYGELGERYKKAKAAASNHFFENVLVPKAMTATEKLLTEREVTDRKHDEVIFNGAKMLDEDGNPVVKVTTTTAMQQPNPTTAIFIMKAAYPDKFKERVEHTGADGGPIKFDSLSVDERRTFLEILEKMQSSGDKP